MRCFILKQNQLPQAFISYAADILADTSTGLNRAELVKQCTKYAVKYGVDIPVSTTDWGDFGSKVKNKRTAMFDNLSAFSKEEQYVIIKELTELPFFSNNDEAHQLHEILIERYGAISEAKVRSQVKGENAMDIHHPKVFISYSWEDADHKEWVKQLADSLLKNGIDATLDQYDLSLGDRLPLFMEKAVTESTFVLIICTPTYKTKSDNRSGGVGYEGHIISGELLAKGNERKFIPIIRKGTVTTAMPNCLAGKLGINLCDSEHYEQNFQDLITTLLGKKKKPEVRVATATTDEKQSSNDSSSEEPVKIMGIITDKVTVPKMDGTQGSALYQIPFQLSKTPSSLWGKLFVQQWNSPPIFSTMHRPGIASVFADEIILNGTTIEEVQKYHRDTLMLCVEQANKMEQEAFQEHRNREEANIRRNNEHFANVHDIAEKIHF